MQLTLKRKSSKQNTLMCQQAEEDMENQRQFDSPLKEIDFSSNHTEDKSLFEAILDNNDCNEEEGHQNVAVNKKRGRKKKIGSETCLVHHPQSAYISKINHLHPSKLNNNHIDGQLFRTQNEFFQSFEIKKHQQQSEFEKESEEDQSIGKFKYEQSQNQTKKGKIISKRRSISTKRRLKFRGKDTISKVDLVTDSIHQRIGLDLNDNFEQYLNL